MNKRLLAFALILVLIASSVPVMADTVTVGDQILDPMASESDFMAYVAAIGEPLSIRIETSSTSLDVKASWEGYKNYGNQTDYNYGEIIYGTPKEVMGNVPTGMADQTEKDGIWRYLGWNRYGDLIANELFPHDSTTNTDPRTWLTRFTDVSGAETTWQRTQDVTNDQYAYMLEAQLRGHGLNDGGSWGYETPWTAERLTEGIYYNPNGYVTNHSKIFLQSYASWKNGFSVRTNIGGYYQVWYGDGMGVDLSLNGAWSGKFSGILGTEEKSTSTAEFGINSITLPVTFTGSVGLGNEWLLADDIEKLTVTLGDAQDPESVKKEGVQVTSLTASRTYIFDRDSLALGTNEIDITATIRVESSYGDVYMKTFTKPIYITVYDAPVELAGMGSTLGEPIISLDGKATPSVTKWTGKDISVTVDASSVLENVLPDKVTSYTLKVNGQQKTQTKVTEAAASFNFTVDCSAFEDDPALESLTEPWHIQAVATLSDGTVVSAQAEAQTIIARGYQPPEVQILTPSKVKLGDYVNIYGTASSPQDFPIVNYYWEINDSYVPAWDGKKGILNYEYPAEGTYKLGLIAIDSTGLNGYGEKTVQVLPPTIEAGIRTGGILKPFRAISVEAVYDTPDKFPVNASKTDWTVSGESGMGLYYDQAIDTKESFQMMTTAPGTIDMSVYLENTRNYHDEAEKQITVAPDQPPVADFSILGVIYRDPFEGNAATIDVFNYSYSPDLDTIGNIQVYYRYDSDNDGNFNDETRQLFYTGAPMDSIEIPVYEVGRYKIEMTATETYTPMAGYESMAVYQSDTTAEKPLSESVITVDNIPPTTNIEITQKDQPVDLYFHLGDFDMTAAELSSYVENTLRPQLEAQGIQIGTVNIEEGEVTQGVTESVFKGGTDMTSTSTAATGLKYADEKYVRLTYFPYIGMYGYLTNSPDVAIRDIRVDQNAYLNPTSSEGETSMVVAADGNYYQFYEKTSKDSSDNYYHWYDLLTFKPATASLTMNLVSTDSKNTDEMVTQQYMFLSTDGTKLIVGRLEEDTYRLSSGLLSHTTRFNNYVYPIVNGSVGSPVRLVSDNKDFDDMYSPSYTADGKHVVYKVSGGYTAGDQNAFSLETGAWASISPTLGVTPVVYSTGTTQFENAIQSVEEYNPGYTVQSYTEDVKYKESGITYTDKYFNQTLYKDGIEVGHLFRICTYDATSATKTRPILYIANRIDENTGKLALYYGRKYEFFERYESTFYTSLENELFSMDAAPSAADRFYILLDNSTLPAVNMPYLENQIGNGLSVQQMTLLTNTQAPAAEDWISLTGGAAINGVDDIAGAIAARFQDAQQGDHFTVLVDSALEMDSFYSDYEGDPLYAGSFSVNHADPDFYDNSEGLSALDGQNYVMTGAAEFSLDKPGLYEIEPKVRDNPKGDDRFDEFRKWSVDGITHTVLAHRRPIADFSLYWTASGGNYAIDFIDKAYDLDHQFSDAEMGITDRLVKYKQVTAAGGTPGDGIWHLGIPATLEAGVYEFRYSVKDIEGAWSVEAVQTFDLESAPPIQLTAQLRPLDSTKFSLGSIPASEWLEVYDVETRFPESHDVKMQWVGPDDTVLSDAALLSGAVSGNVTVSGDVYQWEPVQLKIPKTYQDALYAVRVTAFNDRTEAAVDLPFRVETPIAVTGSVGLLRAGDSAEFQAVTTPYAETVRLTLYKGTPFEYSRNLFKDESATNTWILTEGVPYNLPAGNYVFAFEAETASGKKASDLIYAEAESLEIVDFQAIGYWNHWRGQDNLLGERMANEPHHFLSYECIRFVATISGNAQRVELRLSPELEAMKYTDRYGNQYRYEDEIGETVAFPLEMTCEEGPDENGISIWRVEYILPLADSSLDWENQRERVPYYAKVTAYDDMGTERQLSIEDIDLTGNIFDLLYIQPAGWR
jgi:hypothetical protein